MKAKSIKSFLIVTTAALLSQNTNAQDSTAAFTKISIPHRGKIILTQGTVCSASIDKENDSESTIQIQNGTLKFHSRENGEAHVTVKNLEEVEISGNGSVEAENTIDTRNLKLIISGLGKIEMPVKAEKINTIISGKGNIELSGSANELDATISGAGKVEAEKLQVSKSDISISGAGKIYLDVKDDLNVEVSGVGSVKYINEPARISKSISGIGKIGMTSDDEKTKSGKDTTTVNVGDKKIIIIGDDDKDDDNFHIDIDPGHDNESTTIHYHRGGKVTGHWGGFELGFNNYSMQGFSANLPEGYEYLELNTGKSVAVNLNFFDYKTNILDYHLAFLTGLGVSWNNWKFTGDRTLIPNASELSAYYDTIDYSKNKLTVSYVTLPLLFEFNTNEYEKKSFHVGTGIILGYRIDSHTKQKYEVNDKTRKVKTYDDFNLNPFRYDATLRIGYRGYTAFVSYGLATLFKFNQGPEMHPFTFGLALLNW
ncbi:MAG: GIN domain-containing protein [Bacteroidia bacterium]